MTQSAVAPPIAAQATPTAFSQERIVFSDDLPFASSVAWSPDGTMLAAVDNDGLVMVWDASSKQLLHTINEYPGRDSFIDGQVTFSPDSKYVASGSSDGEVFIWESETGKRVRRFVGLGDDILSIAWSPDGKMLAAGASKVIVWDVKTGETLYRSEGFGRVYDIDFSPDSELLAFGASNGEARIWRSGSGDETLELQAGTRTVRSVVFSPDGQTLAIAFEAFSPIRARVLLWDVASGEWYDPQLEITDGSMILSMDWSPDERYIATAHREGGLQLRDMSTGDVAFQDDPGFYNLEAVDWSPDGRYLAVADWDAIYLYDSLALPTVSVETVSTQALADKPTVIVDVGSPDPLPTPTPVPDSIPQYEPPIYYHFMGRLLPESLSALAGDEIYGTRISPSTNALAFTTASTTLYTYQREPFELLFKRQVGYIVGDVFWSPPQAEQHWLITVSIHSNHRDGEQPARATIWDANTGQYLIDLTGHGGNQITGVAWSPDGAQWLTAGRDGAVLIRDTETGTILQRVSRADAIREYTLFGINRNRAEFNRDGSLIAMVYEVGGGDAFYADNFVTIWNVETGEQLSLVEVPGRVADIAWSPDNPYLIAIGTGWSAEVILVDAREGTRQHTFQHIAGRIFVTWSRDGSLLFAKDDEDHMLIWEVDSKTQHAFIEHVKVGPIQSPDGAHFATVDAPPPGADPLSIVRTSIWDTMTGREITRIDGLRAWYYAQSSAYLVGWDQYTNDIVQVDLDTFEKRSVSS